MAKLSEREAQICRRLRAFREHTKVSRVKFALTIGIGSERLASYESSRAPLRYEVFRSINQHFFINPLWLAIGETSPIDISAFDDSAFLAKINPRALFTEVYDGHLASVLSRSITKARTMTERRMSLMRHMDENKEAWDAYFEEHPGKAEEFLKLLNGQIRKLKKNMRVRKAVRQIEQRRRGKSRAKAFLAGGSELAELGSVEFANEKENVDTITANRKSADMKSELKGILAKVAAFTKAKGAKGELAKTIGVPQSRLSEWLAGKHEPSGDIALKLLRWVERREAK